MDIRQSTILTLGIVSVLGLFAVVYAQFLDQKQASGPTSGPGYGMERSTSKAPVAPVAKDPQTADEVTAGIDAQIAEDSAMLEAEMGDESSDMDAEANSMNDLSQSYDENAY